MRSEANTLLRIVNAKAQLKASEALILAESSNHNDAPQSLVSIEAFRQAKKFRQFIEVFNELVAQPTDSRFETAKLKPLNQHHESRTNDQEAD